MTKSVFHIARFCLLLLLVGCREEALISSTDLQFLQQGILVTTWTENYARYTKQIDTLYVNQGETVLFSSAYALNGSTLSQDSAINLYDSHHWELDGDTISATSFEYQFDSTGYHFCILKTVDFAGDSLKDTVHIFVGTPLALSLKTPPLQASIEPLSDDYVELDWNISGIDPWEKSQCSIYAAVAEGIPLSRDTRWIDILDSVSSLFTNDCKSGTRLKGPLISEKWLQLYNIDLKDSSLTVYWGVKARVYTENGFEEYASAVSAFNTLFLEGDSSVIEIKPTYENLVAGTPISSQVILVSAMGDTLKKVTYDSIDSVINIKVMPQSNLQIHAIETLRTDYEATPITVNVPERSKIRLADSIVFTDKVPPKAVPVKTALSIDDSIQFYFMDNGSGIGANQKKFIIADYDTVGVQYNSSILSFANPCRRECNLKVPIPDNARNRNTELFWTLKFYRDSMYISGPFAPKEESW